MAKKGMPYRFMVDGVKFDVVFDTDLLKLDHKSKFPSSITLAFARKSGTVKTLVAQAIRNPEDDRNALIGQRWAFKRLMALVWLYWSDQNLQPKIFVQHARDIAFTAGMWNDEE